MKLKFMVYGLLCLLACASSCQNSPPPLPSESVSVGALMQIGQRKGVSIDAEIFRLTGVDHASEIALGDQFQPFLSMMSDTLPYALTEGEAGIRFPEFGKEPLDGAVKSAIGNWMSKRACQSVEIADVCASAQFANVIARCFRNAADPKTARTESRAFIFDSHSGEEIAHDIFVTDFKYSPNRLAASLYAAIAKTKDVKTALCVAESMEGMADSDAKRDCLMNFALSGRGIKLVLDETCVGLCLAGIYELNFH